MFFITKVNSCIVRFAQWLYNEVMKVKNTSKSIDIALLDVHKRLLLSAQKGSILTLLQCAYEIFKAPIVLTNERYRLIALWPQEAIGDAVFDNYLNSPVLSIDLVQHYTKEYLQDKELSFAPFYAKEGIVGAFPRIFAEVSDLSTDKPRTLGHFGILLGNNPLLPWHLEAAGVLSEMLAILLTRNPGVIANDGKTFAHHLYDLLDPALSRNDFDNVSRDFQCDFPLPWRMLYTELGSSTELKTLSPAVVADLLHRFPKLAMLHDANDLVLLTGENTTDSPSSESSLRMAAELLYQYGYQSVLLPEVYFPERMRHMRKLAHLTMEYIRKNGGFDGALISHEDLAGAPLFYALSKHPAAPGMCHPLLDRLRLYDNENSSEYYLTLKQYCEHNYRMAKTAQALHIHRNTLIYRLDRVQEVFAIDFNDDRLLADINLSFRIQEQLKIY